MTILGIGGSIHDFASCLIRDGDIVALEDERLTKVRYSAGSENPCRPSSSYCLEALQCRLQDVDLIAGNDELLQALDVSTFPDALYMNHHLAHAFSSFFTSPFDEAAILVVDGAGSRVAVDSPLDPRETTTFAYGKGNNIEVLSQVIGDLGGVNPLTMRQTLTSNSLGEFYRAIAESLGLSWLSGPGKAMGLASYGAARSDDRFVEPLLRFVDLLPQGHFRINLNGRDGLIERLWQMRERTYLKHDKFLVDSAIAYAGQVVLEYVLLHALRFLHERVKTKHLCLIGGVALNALANGRILAETGFEHVHIFFAPGDSGTAVGAAIWGALQKSTDLAHSLRFPIRPFLGKPYSTRAIEDALMSMGLHGRSPTDLFREVALLLAEGKIVAWFQGRSEFGPRALGNRSLLADPRSASVRDYINKEIKAREWYRPLAPAVLHPLAEQYFHCHCESPWMQFAWPVRQDVRDVLVGVTHVDGGARVQTVKQDENPRFYHLLESFYEVSGVPVLLNTSLNIKGNPIAETPRDAIEVFLRSPIHALVLGDILVTKS